MKRLFAAMLALVAAMAISSSASANPPIHWTVEQLKWRTQVSGTNAQGYVDSLTASIQGAVGTTGSIDTTVWFPTSKIAVPVDGTTNTTAQGLFKVWISNPSIGVFTSTDTLFIAMETSPDGVTPIPNTTFSNMVVTTAGDDGVSLHFQEDSDAGNLNVFCAPYIRFRVRSDGNTGAIVPSAEIRIAFPTAWDN